MEPLAGSLVALVVDTEQLVGTAFAGGPGAFPEERLASGFVVSGPVDPGPVACLPTPPPEGKGNPSVCGAPRRGRLQLVKSRGVSPGGGEVTPGSCTSIVEASEVVEPAEEATTPCPGILAIVWLQVSVGTDG